MEYLNSLIQKWMPNNSRVQVDSHPRLSGIMDTINSTLAHGPKTRLPLAFYDQKGRDIIDQIGVEEWFSGFQESTEYRTVGIGGLAGDIVARMVGSVEKSGNDGLLEIGGEDGALGTGRGGEKDIKLGLSGCHDTTLAAVLASLGCFEGEKWPAYTTHIAFELFKEAQAETVSIGGDRLDEPVTARAGHKQNQGRLSTFFGSGGKEKLATEGMSRKSSEELSTTEKEKLNGHYVRIRYNDRPMIIPGCRLPGRHLNGDESFCTLVSSWTFSLLTPTDTT
jgi:acid phosphatase